MKPSVSQVAERFHMQFRLHCLHVVKGQIDQPVITPHHRTGQYELKIIFCSIAVLDINRHLFCDVIIM